MKYIYGCVNVRHPNNSATLDRTIFALLQKHSKFKIVFIDVKRGDTSLKSHRLSFHLHHFFSQCPQGTI